MIKIIFRKIKRTFTKNTVVESFDADGTPYKVIDHTSILPLIKNTRDLSFLYDGKVYAQSSVYLNPNETTQPAYTIVQEVIRLWSKTFELKSALVLGCGGCTIPRYICRNFNAEVTGVELSDKMIEIAKKHFTTPYMEKSFTVVRGNAIEYVRSYPLTHKQSFIFSDIFCVNGVVPESFTQSYLGDLFNCSAEDSVIIFNLLGTEFEEITDFKNKITLDFDIKEILTSGNARFLVLARCTDKVKAHQFKKRIYDSAVFNIK